MSRRQIIDKRCSSCGETKPWDDLHWPSRRQANGNITPKGETCSDCVAKGVAERAAERASQRIPADRTHHTCRTCNATHPWTLEFWPKQQGNGKPTGNICKACAKLIAKARVRTNPSQGGNPLAPRLSPEEIIGSLKPAAPAALAASDKQLPAIVKPTVAALEARKPGEKAAKMSLARAVAESVDLVNATAAEVLEILRGYVHNERHPLHEKALMFFAERAAPLRALSYLADDAAGVEAGKPGGPAMPSVTIVVQSVNRDSRPSITVQPVEDAQDAVVTPTFEELAS